MKRILFLLSALLSSYLLFAEQVSIDGIVYDLDEVNKTAEVYEINEYNPAGIEINEKVIYNSIEYIVNSLHQYAFSWCNVTYISLPNTITTINDKQFYELEKLENIDLGNNITYIGESAFAYCKSLKSINLPESVIEIGYGAFTNCTSLTSLEIPNKVTDIGSIIFEGCTALKSIKIGDSVTSLPEDFSSLTSLEEFIVSPENKMYSSENGILFSKDKTVLLNCPLGIDCSSYQIPLNVETIYYNAFKNHAEITSIVFHDNIKIISYAAFDNCIGLEKVEIPRNVRILENTAFEGCINLKNINVDSENKYYSSENGVLFNKTKTTLLRYPLGKLEESYILPNITDTIANNAFINCSNLIKLTLHDNVNCISSGTFYGTKVYEDESNWDNGVFYIGNYLIEADRNKLQGDYVVREGTRYIAISAFHWCGKLTSIEFPNSLEIIDSNAFRWCSQLRTINIGDNVSVIKPNSFYSYSRISEYNVSLANKYFSSEDGVLFNKDKTELLAYPPLKEDTSYTIPNSVKRIGHNAFSECEKLINITIPEGVVEIGSAAFYYCTGLTSIKIPNSLTYLGSSAFFNCTSLESISLGSNIDCIETDPFTNTKYFSEESNWEDGVLYIKEYLISTNPEKINSSCKIKDGTKLITDYAFYNCKNLIDVDIPSSVNVIGAHAFIYCVNLNQVNIPEGVTELKAGTFYECTNLKSVTFPCSTDKLNYDVFYNCENLNEIFIYSLEVPEVYPYTFTDDWKYNKYTFLYDRVDLYVPCESLEDYKSHEIFGQFKNIKCIGAEQTELEEDDVKIDVDENSVQISWPKVEGAESYTITITKGDNTVYVIEFDANGQIISFNEISNRSALIGFTYSIHNLKSGTDYSYKVIANDNDGNQLEVFTGDFTTLGELVSIEETLEDIDITISEGTIMCSVEGFVIYNTVGQDVTALNGSLKSGIYVVVVDKECFKAIVK